MQKLSSEQEPSHLILLQRNGMMNKLNCPFQAICNQSVGELTEGTVFTIESVFSTDDGKIAYMIDGKPYYHTHFLVFYGLFPHYSMYQWTNSPRQF